ncbi:winged helix DNA-binding protein [Rhizobium oryzicola]|uniref:Winged helix DNA-binding protein n=1 Tax=Rhizobium oryzicola TaxID=1232668 RepID=A0ABT8SWJ4_9HYPH|nr:winged helix DNA-binding protein [Rhizobium oryzicola]MDO1582731.1 winged helix DNA-binding protein [Rhizobium oryzicola]
MTPENPKADPALELSEAALTEFEWSLWRISAAFLRWQSECSSELAGASLSGLDTAVLHTIRYRNKPKGLGEISRLLGRDDTANIQYAIKKLQGLQCIERVKGRSRKDTLYTPTRKGSKLTQDYRSLRRDLLISLIQKMDRAEKGLGETTEMLELLTSFYDTAARRVASGSHPVERS